jgi:hypothetical protein
MRHACTLHYTRAGGVDETASMPMAFVDIHLTLQGLEVPERLTLALFVDVHLTLQGHFHGTARRKFIMDLLT